MSDQGTSQAAGQRPCPWCGQTSPPKEGTASNPHGQLRELRCGSCDALLSVGMVESARS